MADYTVSSGNVFKDLGLPEPEEKLAKAKLAYKINCLIAAQEMTQKESSCLLGNQSIQNDATEKRSTQRFYC